MKYEDYMKLGFGRLDLNDSVEFDQTGYYGFYLKIELSDKMSIGVSSGDLDKPKLYIKRANEERYHIIPITGEIVKDLLSKPTVKPNHYTAC